MLNNIRGVVSFRARGNKLYKFINAVRESKIICMSQFCRSEEYYGKIYGHQLKALQYIADEYGVELFIDEKKGIVFKLLKYKFRYGILAGIILALAFIFYISNTVIIIEVEDNDLVSTEQIVSNLEEFGIHKGSFIPSLDLRTCEKQLRITIDELAWVGIRHTGCRMVIEVEEASPKPNMLSKTVPCNIISTKDAQITSAIVYSGQLMQIKGDGVKKGDVLISGVFTDGNGNITSLHAMGDIRGIYTEKMIFSQPYSDKIHVNVDEIYKSSIDFFSFKIPLYLKKPEVENYDYDENTTYFMFFDKEMPIGISHSTYTPYTVQNVTYSDEEAEQLLLEKMNTYEANFLSDEGTKILDKKILRKVYNDRLEYEVTYSVEGNIGEASEIFIKN